MPMRKEFDETYEQILCKEAVLPEGGLRFMM